MTTLETASSTVCALFTGWGDRRLFAVFAPRVGGAPCPGMPRAHLRVHGGRPMSAVGHS